MDYLNPHSNSVRISLLLAPHFLMMKLKHTEVIQLIIGGRARLLSHKIYRHSISCYSVAGRIQLKDLSPCSYPEGTPKPNRLDSGPQLPSFSLSILTQDAQPPGFLFLTSTDLKGLVLRLTAHVYSQAQTRLVHFLSQLHSLKIGLGPFPINPANRI